MNALKCAKNNIVIRGCCCMVVLALLSCGNKTSPRQDTAPIPDTMPCVLEQAYVNLTETPAEIEAWRALPEEEDAQVLDRALFDIFGGETPALNEETALRLLAYVPQVFETGKWVNARYGASYLKEKGGYCVGMASAFVSLARRMGFPARMNSMHNFTAFRGHTTAEIYYENAWHHFEPTYAIVFYTNPEYDGLGRIPSFRELVYDRSLRKYCLRVPVPLWEAKYEAPKSAIPQPLDPAFAVAPEEAPLLEQYIATFNESFPCVYHDNVAALFPVALDLSAQRRIMLGDIDGDDLDQFGIRGESGWPRFAGIRTIGNTRAHAVMGLFMVRTESPGYVRLTLHFLNKEAKQDGLRIVELKDAIVGSIVSEAGKWRADFLTQSTDALLLITNPSDTAYIDAVEAEFFTEAPSS